jgi:hypothetical protein
MLHIVVMHLVPPPPPPKSPRDIAFFLLTIYLKQIFKDSQKNGVKFHDTRFN